MSIQEITAQEIALFKRHAAELCTTSESKEVENLLASSPRHKEQYISIANRINTLANIKPSRSVFEIKGKVIDFLLSNSAK